MKHKYKKTILLTVLLLFASLFTTAVFAKTVNFDFSDGNKTLTDLIFKILDFLLIFGGFAATGALMYSGFLFMTSGGNPEELKKAKDIIIYTVVGVIVLALAYSVPNVINDLLSG